MTLPLNHTKFVITSNYEPDFIWDADQTLMLAIKRRFNIIHVPVRTDFVDL